MALMLGRQADVSHEILRPTPRRPPSSNSPPRGPRYDYHHIDDDDDGDDDEQGAITIFIMINHIN